MSEMYEIQCLKCEHFKTLYSENDLINSPYRERLICTVCGEKGFSFVELIPEFEALRSSDANHWGSVEDPFNGLLSEDTPNGGIASMDELTPN